MFLIGSTTLSSNSGSMIFTNIPQIYDHLHIRFKVRGTTTNLVDSALFATQYSANGDFTRHAVISVGTSVGTEYDTNSNAPFTFMPSNGSPSNIVGSGTIDILDYANTTTFKQIRMFGGFDSNNATSGQNYRRLDIVSGLQKYTQAVTTVQLACYIYAGGNGFLAGSTMQVYGYFGNIGSGV